MDVDSIIWRFSDLVATEVSHDRFELERINRSCGLSSVGLERSGNKALREEECWEPVGWWLTLVQPDGHELKSLDKIRNPRAKWLERGVANVHPLSWYLIVLELERHALEVHGHDNCTLNSLI